jgi:hypothetical protein
MGLAVLTTAKRCCPEPRYFGALLMIALCKTLQDVIR